jgi:hypothetical protein
MWCWVAVAASISDCLKGSQSHTQCSLAGVLIPCHGCCSSSPPPQHCDYGGKLEAALLVTGNLQQQVNGAATWRRLDQEIGNGYPVGALLQPTGGGLHYVAISGTRTGSRVQVDDPANGRQGFMAHSQLANNFLMPWIETVFTRP